MPLCTTDDVAALLRRSLTTAEEEGLELLIPLIQGEMEMVANRPLSPVVIVGEVARQVGDHVFLNKTPVVSVQAVRGLGSTTTVGGFDVRPWGLLFSGTSATADAFAPAEWASVTAENADREFEVDYTAGVGTTDWRYQGARSLLLSRLIRISNKATDDALGVSQLTQEGYTAAYLTEGWTDQEMATLKRLKKRTVAR